MRSQRARLADMLEALTGIEETVRGLDRESFGESWIAQRAVERGLEIISEASRDLDDRAKVACPEVSWPQIAGIGNILRHEYHRVEPDIVWNITREHLPRLAAAVRRLLRA